MPGYIIHLTETEIIRRILREIYNINLPDTWWNHFQIGSLLPDSRIRGDKAGSHFWNPATMDHLAIAPDLNLFHRAYGEMPEGPGMLGYWVHLHLDSCYVREFWQEHFRFLDEDGKEENLRAKVTQVEDNMVGRTIPVKEFFTDLEYYGDYTRMNTYFTERYGLEIPRYYPSRWEHFPVKEVKVEDFARVLEELKQLLQVQDTWKEEKLRVFDRDLVEAFIENTAKKAVAFILPSVKREAERYPEYDRIDLHAHTCCSDGSLTPEELVQLAAQKKLEALAVTDHDTMEGVRAAMAEGERLGIEIIPGMEFSTMEEGRDVHMVGLFLDEENPDLVELMKSVVQRRKDRNRKMVQRLMDAGFDITWEDVATLGDGIWTRGNLAQLLVDHGYGESVTDCMNKYLSRGCVGYEPKVAISPSEAIDVVHKAGGLVFVAHFYQIDKKSLENSARICRNILAAGADGLETRYCRYDDEMRRMADEMAEEFGCLRSGGSDFHGKIKPGLELADGYGDLVVPGDFLREMKAWLGLSSDAGHR